MVTQRSHKPCVEGSIPSITTKNMEHSYMGYYAALSTLRNGFESRMLRQNGAWDVGFETHGP